MYIQVKTSVIHNIHLDISRLATSACTAHQITKNQMIAADKKVTTGLKRRKIPIFVFLIVPHFQLTRSQRNLSEAFSSISIVLDRRRRWIYTRVRKLWMPLFPLKISPPPWINCHPTGQWYDTICLTRNDLTAAIFFGWKNAACIYFRLENYWIGPIN